MAVTVKRVASYEYDGQFFATKADALRAKARAELEAILTNRSEEVELMDFLIDNARDLSKALSSIARSTNPVRRPRKAAVEGAAPKTPGRRGRKPRSETQAPAEAA
jgi:hypothetical protein